MESTFYLLILLVVGLNAETTELTEEEMDQTIKPCLVYNVNCPRDGRMGSYDQMKKELEKMKVGIVLMGGRMPLECECDGGERCDRQCYYALMKVAVFELKAGQQQLQEKRRRRKRTVFQIGH